MRSSTSLEIPPEALFNRCRVLLHECLDAAKEAPSTEVRAGLVNRLRDLICRQQAYRSTDQLSAFEQARSLTYELLCEEGYDCCADAAFADWLVGRRVLQVA